MTEECLNSDDLLCKVLHKFTRNEQGRKLGNQRLTLCNIRRRVAFSQYSINSVKDDMVMCKCKRKCGKDVDISFECNSISGAGEL